MNGAGANPRATTRRAGDRELRAYGLLDRDEVRLERRCDRPPPPANERHRQHALSDVSLPAGDVSTQLCRLFAGVDVTPLVSLNFSVQYDNVSRIVRTQNRRVWIVNPGNTVFLVYQ